MLTLVEDIKNNLESFPSNIKFYQISLLSQIIDIDLAKCLRCHQQLTNNWYQSDLATTKIAAERQVDNFIQSVIPIFDDH